ncbi:MAG TPA: ornithine cyclodeaminase family protein [Xanthobacteraceae bacterium]|jgi:ornithine cyclodeaminase|nr:ornithine cyclodeaminase family protein [Xanthobacteraceae bacterium]
MRVVTAEEIDRVLTPPALIDALHDAFRGDFVVPTRHHHTISCPGADATLLMMPAWTSTGAPFLGCKLVTVFPDNNSRGEASVQGQYLLMSGETGKPLAIIDGPALTAWRTACASALATRFLARKDAAHLVMVGSGTLAPHLIRAHASVRPLTRISLWNRTKAHAIELAFRLAEDGCEIEVVPDLEAAIRSADIVSCATLSATPLVRGAWLKPGAHVDLVGGFTPQMREADDDAVRRARIYVDTRSGALKEAGDIIDPMVRRVISDTAVLGDLFELCRGTVSGRASENEITLFKSVGTAVEDLAAAMLVWRCLGN